MRHDDAPSRAFIPSRTRIVVRAVLTLGLLAFGIAEPIEPLPRFALPIFAMTYLVLLVFAAFLRIEVDASSLHVRRRWGGGRNYPREKVHVSFGEVIGSLGRSDITIMTIRPHSGRSTSFPLLFFSAGAIQALRHALREVDGSPEM